MYTGRRSLKDLPRQKADSPTDGEIFHVCGGKPRCWGRTQRHGPPPEKGLGEAALATPSPQRSAFWQTATHPSPPSPPPPASQKLEPSRRVWVHTGLRKFNTGRKRAPRQAEKHKRLLVQGRSQDVLAIRRELHKGHGRVVIICRETDRLMPGC